MSLWKKGVRKTKGVMAGNKTKLFFVGGEKGLLIYLVMYKDHYLDVVLYIRKESSFLKICCDDLFTCKIYVKGQNLQTFDC